MGLVVGPTDHPSAMPNIAGATALNTVYPDCSAARLYTAAVRAVTELGFAITRRDDAGFAVSFRPHGPTQSWPVDEMTAVVHPKEQAAQIVVGGSATGGFRPVMTDWHQAERLGVVFLKRVATVLPRVPEPDANVPAGRSVADQLQSLADLRDRALLTEEEFSAAKKMLLG
jgi:hypothetical protein